ncbi:hypothetical protein TWF730_008455 [Orbilia blumenaviensis]|uniref:Uncharacterized protein n=1 Tax=Orbilia blumenaviensis TaxID=1796055 RepID=A0AAV9V5E0_9PEZI
MENIKATIDPPAAAPRRSTRAPKGQFTFQSPFSSRDQNLMSQVEFLNSRLESSPTREMKPWGYAPLRKRERVDYEREDHPIFYEDFFSAHGRAVNVTTRKYSNIIKWAQSVRTARLQAQDRLKELARQITIKIQNQEFKDMEGLIPMWEARLREMEPSQRTLREDNLKYTEWKNIRTGAQRLAVAQKHMEKTVLETLPKFPWKSSTPLKRILEIRDQVSVFEVLSMDSRAGLTTVILANERAHGLYASCTRLLIEATDLAVAGRRGGPGPERRYSPSGARGGFPTATSTTVVQSGDEAPDEPGPEDFDYPDISA